MTHFFKHNLGKLGSYCLNSTYIIQLVVWESTPKIFESAELQETGFFSSHDRIEVSLELNCQLLYGIEYKQDLVLLPYSLIVKDDILDGEFY